MYRLRESSHLLLTFIFLIFGCSNENSWNKGLPSSQDLGSPRGYKIGRSLIHLHSPISYDACDAGNPNCLSDLRAALCTNKVDFAFLTDHPDNMAKTNFSDLLLNVAGDEALTQGGSTIGNKFKCGDSHFVQVMAGYEDQLMPIGMTKHLDPDQTTRSTLYTGATAELVTRLKNETDAIVFVPHTESRSQELLASLGMDGIEVYNLHANINPKMRHDFLGFDYFGGLLDLSVYWVDPYGKQQPDMAFMSFLEVSATYAKKWNTLYSQGKKVIGIAGNDSHQNFFSGKANDGDRVDSHRRLIRWITNHFLVTEMTLTAIKDAIRKGRGWVVFEGLGSPKDMDFYSKNDTSTVSVGETITLTANSTKLFVNSPKLHSSSPRSSVDPTIIVRLKRVDSSGNETIVDTSVGAPIEYSVKETGAYRAEVSIVPLHIKSFLGFKDKKATQENPWIITNPIYVQ